MNLLKVLSSTDWGADTETLLLIYKSHIRSVLDYGCIVYGSARKSYLQMLDPIHHQALRLCLGAFKTSPIESLYVEANEPSLYDRRQKLALQYATKIKGNPSNIAFDTVFDTVYQTLYQSNPNKIPSFGVRISDILEDVFKDADMNNIIGFSYPQTPTWLLPLPSVDVTLCKHEKANTSPDVYKTYFIEKQEHYKHYFPLYTDGSKDGLRVGAAAVIYNTQSSVVRLPAGSSIFSAELTALKLAFDYVEELDSVRNFIIYTDSLSSIQALQSRKWENPLVQNLLIKYHELTDRGQHILLCWIPSHIGIKGNDFADACAKAALNINVCTDIKVPYTDFYHTIRDYQRQKWQDKWNQQQYNKLKEIKPNIGKKSHHRLTRRDEVVLHRCRIGHSHLTHAYIL